MFDSGSASHQLSATALLGSPDGSRHPLDVYEFAEEDYRHQNGSGTGHHQNGRAGLWECLVGCRHRLDQQLARRRVSLHKSSGYIHTYRVKRSLTSYISISRYRYLILSVWKESRRVLCQNFFLLDSVRAQLQFYFRSHMSRANSQFQASITFDNS